MNWILANEVHFRTNNQEKSIYDDHTREEFTEIREWQYPSKVWRYIVITWLERRASTGNEFALLSPEPLFGFRANGDEIENSMRALCSTAHNENRTHPCQPTNFSRWFPGAALITSIRESYRVSLAKRPACKAQPLSDGPAL